jgi:hypothetical protein
VSYSYTALNSCYVEGCSAKERFSRNSTKILTDNDGRQIVLADGTHQTSSHLFR